jgi:VWFA-related protein
MPRSHARQARLFAVLLLAAAAGTPPRAAPPASAPDAPQPTPYIERSTSELVLIEVYVTDNKGQPILDLVKSDLVLKIDHKGLPKEIASLEYVAPQPREAPPEPAIATAGAGVPPGETKAAALLPEPGSPHSKYPRRFLIFFDDSTSTPISMTNARNAALELLARSSLPGDQFALAAYEEKRKLQILQDFTTDRAALTRALKLNAADKKRFCDFAIQREMRQEEIHRLEKEAGSDTSGQNGAGRVYLMKGDFAMEDSRHLTQLLAAVRILVETIAPWPGYKALVFMGDGVPENPAFDYNLNDPRMAITSDLSGLAFAAGSANVTMHTVQTEGVVAGNSGGVAAASRRSNALATLALNTGGLSRSTNDLTLALTEVEESAEGYYLLGYVPEGEPDGQYHTVDLTVKGRGTVHLRYRRGYTRYRPSEARTRAVQAAYLAPELHAELGLDLTAVPGPADATQQTVDLVTYVPPRRILFLPQPGGAAALLDVGYVGIDPQGKETLRVARRVVLTLDEEHARNGGKLGLNLYSRVRLPKGTQTITAVVADAQSESIGGTRVTVGAGATHGVVGLSLYSMDASSLWIEIDPRAKAAAAGEGSTPYTVGPALKSRFGPDERVRCGFRTESALPEGSQPLRLSIVKQDEVVRVRSIDDPGGAPLPLDGLADGDYLVRVQQEQDGKTANLGEIPFSIQPSSR